jgi:hypothetical protein
MNPPVNRDLRSMAEARLEQQRAQEFRQEEAGYTPSWTGRQGQVGSLHPGRRGTAWH